MKKYIKPMIEEELIELEDIITSSAIGEGDANSDGIERDGSDWIQNK